MNTTVVMAAAKGIVIAYYNTILFEFGGSTCIGKIWAKSLLLRMGFVKRRRAKISVDGF